MNKDIIRAREMLERIGYTCVLVKDEIVYRSEKRGVTPLLGHRLGRIFGRRQGNRKSSRIVVCAA